MSRVAGGGNMAGQIGIEHGTTGYSARKNFDDIPIDFKLPPGNVARGRKYFKKHCVCCHSVYPDGSVFSSSHSLGYLPHFIFTFQFNKSKDFFK